MAYIQQLASSLYVQNLEWIKIKGCHNLKYLFPSFGVKHFVQLHSLSILDCKIMEEIIFVEGLTEDERMSKMWFPQLKFLKLQDFPKLRRFCYETDNEFPFLRELVLTNCPVMKTFISKSATEDVGDEPQIDQNAQGNDLELDNSALFNEKASHVASKQPFHSNEPSFLKALATVAMSTGNPAHCFGYLN
ncbi:Cc-nbs-lrr resistance-like protein [Theobroma cacao]|uniref:Cc-nbs-lrr resistance-like protein n=1 Tax=Theobroma cacao TaxID=3641 RepID=S1RU14_THECC|nr:Cc-nbs-lrr resistance-like protein [Theobroma cacao]